MGSSKEGVSDMNNEQLEIVEGFDPLKLDENLSPNNVLTEREIATQKKGLPIYRMMFKKIKWNNLT